jgi:hypothetical protein
MLQQQVKHVWIRYQSNMQQEPAGETAVIAMVFAICNEE